jgi:hypothetical protein
MCVCMYICVYVFMYVRTYLAKCHSFVRLSDKNAIEQCSELFITFHTIVKIDVMINCEIDV